MKYWIEWEAKFEGFTYSEAVTEAELIERWSDSTINIISVEPLD